MTNNALLPGWAMPDYMARRMNEVLNNKPITPEGELADVLEDMARDIALIEPDPEDWGGWVIFFLDQLEEEERRRRRGFDFNTVLGTMVNEFLDHIRNNRAE